jgi:predicted dehydrogenase
MSDDPIPVAVVGTGNMGTNHARVYDELPGSELVEIVEPDEERTAELTAKYDVTVRESAEDITEAEAATVSVPNEYHRPVAEQLLSGGLDILVEKPLAMSVEDAEAIVEAAETTDAVLQVGHIERFNPAVQTLAEILRDENLIAIEAHRLGPFNEQLSEESVVFDLMIHDMDIVDYLVAGDLAHLDAVGTRSRSAVTDHAVTTMQYECGVLATTVASHVTHGKIRKLDVTTKDAFITLDYQEQKIMIQRRGTEQMTELGTNSGYRAETVTERPYVRTREPLKNELEHFIDCIRTRNEPRIDGQDGAKAVRRAEAVINQIKYDRNKKQE